VGFASSPPRVRLHQRVGYVDGADSDAVFHSYNMAIDSEKNIDVSKYRNKDGSIDRPEWLDDDIECYISGGELWGRGPHGEFPIDPPRGSPTPIEGKCAIPLKFSTKRYGETRYCMSWQLTDERTCKKHKGMASFMDNWTDMIKHGGFAQKYLIFVKKLSPLKFIFAVEMFGGLMEMSDIDFEVTHELRDLDTSDSQFVEEDSVEITLPIPTNDAATFNASELWQAALDEVKMQNMQEVIFDEGVSQESVSASADMEGHITDTITEKREHHLHLPLSRLTKDIKNHMKNGGVDLNDDDESSVLTFQKNDYTLSVEPDDEFDMSGEEGESGDVAAEFHSEIGGE